MALVAAPTLCAQGYGNPRIVARGAPFPAPPAHSTEVDLGGDEQDELEIGGGINGTRIFSRQVPGRTIGFADNTKMFFFNVYTPGNSYPRPKYNQWMQRSFNIGTSPWVGTWWDYVQANPVVPHPSGSGERYTQGADKSDGSATWRRARVLLGVGGFAQGRPPFMRSLECDFSPSLLPDIHPAWGIYSPFLDVFAGNPWFHQNHSECALNDNPFLYYSGSGWIPLEGTINPPGAYLADPVMGYIGQQPLGDFGPFGYAGGPTYSVNAWGYGDTAGPDITPDTGWLGLRANCQVGAQGPTDEVPLSNLQTGLAINGPGPESGGAGTSSAPKVKLPAAARFADIEKAVQRAVRELARRRK